MKRAYRGIWKITGGHEPIVNQFGTTYSLFLDGVKRASCARNVRFGYAMAWDQPGGDYLKGATRAIQCLDLSFAEAKCLEFAGLSPDEVDRSAFDDDNVSDAFVKAFGKE